ncbi:sugar phosphate isomerase/epimerase family protein [Flavihumibacter petaseus]|uniref:Putative xylose isomerase n=1 Tax=Flavihumibacter petaseus NBRC 106054 TaxID=1220578 RepID=A0A0E9N0E0_9BACT|nr:sugar phosphate isomerase/epimerase family protein [Flavihumibacter petaseus]GAO43096.1 putative xylose isomerase [Flavihumibacter petaseus NBRC 106054]
MSYQYSIILGNLGNTCDRFCKGYKDNPSSPEMLSRALAAMPGISGIELVGTWDIHSGNVKEMKQRLADAGVACASIIPDTFSPKEYGKGTITSRDPAIRKKSLDYLREMSYIALEMDCNIVNLWMAQDGYDYLLAADYDQGREWLKENTQKLAEEFPSLRFALEYKPKEPRNFSYHARMADSILAAKETGCSNVGITIDTGHSFVAGENVAEAVVLAKRAGDMLFHMHFNDNHGSWDDDMIVGTVHFATYIDLLFWLKKTGYNGWISMDQYPYREDAAEAIAESIRWVQHYERLVDAHFDEIDSLIKENDAIRTSRFLRKLVGA